MYYKCIGISQNPNMSNDDKYNKLCQLKENYKNTPIVLEFGKTNICNEYRWITVPQEFTHNKFNYKGEHNFKMTFGEKCIKDNPRTLLAFVCAYAKLCESIVTFGRNRDRKEYYMEYSKTDDAIDKRIELHIDCSERFKYCLNKWRKFMPNDKKKIYFANRAEYAREYRKTDYYLNTYLLERKKTGNRRCSNKKSYCKRNNIQFNLTVEECQKFMYSQCIICGEKPKFPQLSWVCMDNPLGAYDMDNTIPLCNKCGRMKGSNTVGLFIDIINYICHVNNWHSNAKKINVETTNYMKFICNGVGWRTYNKWNETLVSRKIKSYISEDYYYKLTRNTECHYCKISYKFIGIDRLNSNNGNRTKKPYTKKNCVSCCQVCNYIKSDINFEDFKEQCKKIIEYTNNIQNS